MQTSNYSTPRFGLMHSFRIRDLAITLALGIVLVLASYYSQTEMLEFQLWRRFDWNLISGVIPITFFWSVHQVLGLSLFMPGLYRVLEVIRVNQSVHAGKNQQLRLLTSGVYSDRRHPMTGLFMIIVAGFLIVLQSAIGLILVCLFVVFFHLATLYEEKTWLLPIFGKEYEAYMKAVPNRYFNRTQLAHLIVVLVFGFVGVFF